jgi:hypothetical protein
LPFLPYFLFHKIKSIFYNKKLRSKILFYRNPRIPIGKGGWRRSGPLWGNGSRSTWQLRFQKRDSIAAARPAVCLSLALRPDPAAVRPSVCALLRAIFRLAAGLLAVWLEVCCVLCVFVLGGCFISLGVDCFGCYPALAAREKTVGNLCMGVCGSWVFPHWLWGRAVCLYACEALGAGPVEGYNGIKSKFSRENLYVLIPYKLFTLLHI